MRYEKQSQYNNINADPTTIDNVEKASSDTSEVVAEIGVEEGVIVERREHQR